MTGLLGDSIKLWLLFPPSDGNLEVLSKVYQEDSKLALAYEKLEGGRLFCTDRTRFMYLPPGWLHATFTVHGGLTPGIDFIAAGCLNATRATLQLDLASPHFQAHDAVAFLRCILCGVPDPASEGSIKHAQAFCAFYKRLVKHCGDKRKKSYVVEWGKALQHCTVSMNHQGKVCRACQAPWNHHS